jgi:hypothetical protein
MPSAALSSSMAWQSNSADDMRMLQEEHDSTAKQ